MMHMFTSPTENAISLINHVTDMSTKLEEMHNELVKHATADFTDKIDIVSESVDEIEPTLMVSIEEHKHFSKYVLSLNKSLQVKRDEMLNRIDKRENTETQTNTMSELYDEDNLISEITMPNEGEVISTYFRAESKQITDVKEYSVLALVNRFKAEDDLLERIYDNTKTECELIANILNVAKTKLTTAKRNCDDPEFISKFVNITADDINTIKEFEEFVNDTRYSKTNVANVKYKLIKLFQIYQDILHNYQIYDKAVTSYVSFVLESVFGGDSTYEIM